VHSYMKYFFPPSNQFCCTKTPSPSNEILLVIAKPNFTSNRHYRLKRPHAGSKIIHLIF
jgi:hypothetical protein